VPVTDIILPTVDENARRTAGRPPPAAEQYTPIWHGMNLASYLLRALRFLILITFSCNYSMMTDVITCNVNYGGFNLIVQFSCICV